MQMMNSFKNVSTYFCRMSVCLCGLAILCLFAIVCSSCQKEYDDVELVYQPNPSYPQRKDEVKILAIGNSFTIDALYYFSQLIDSAHINREKLCVYSATAPSARMDKWLNVINNSETVRLTNDVVGVKMEDEGSLHHLLNQAWDVIIIQQASDVSYKWHTYKCVSEYVERIKSICPNKNLCVFFQQVWSHTPNEDPYMFGTNVNCSRRIEFVLGEGCVIPTGVAIQNARNTRLNDGDYLTSDKWHLSIGMGRYVAALTWFETLLSPVFDLSIKNNTARPEGEFSDEDLEIAKQCVLNAIEHPFELYTIE